MKILKTVLISVVVVVVLAVIVGFLLPATAQVERSTVIDAPAYTVFALVESPGAFNSWSPWYDLDPEAEYEYKGPDYGVGATMSWHSEVKEVGSGTQAVTATEPYSSVRTSLDFGAQGTADGYFLLEPAEGGTKVTWGFTTDFGRNLIGRYLGAFLFDSMVGRDFEKGLSRLKTVAEGLPDADWTGLEIEVTQVEPQTLVYVSSSSSQDPEAIGQALEKAFGQVMSFMAKSKLEQAGPPVAITTSWDEDGYVFDAGVPVLSSVDDIDVGASSGVQVGTSYGGKVVKAVHVGAYTALPASWEKSMAFVHAHGYDEAGRPWEAYASDPTTVDEESLITNLYFPVK